MCAFVGFLCEVVILLDGYEQDKFYGAPRFAIQASGRPQTHALDRATAVIAIIYLLTPWSRVLLEKLTGFAANQEIPRILWNPKVPLPYSKAPANCPYPEPTPSSPHNLPTS